jgi:hypothetical protein
MRLHTKKAARLSDRVSEMRAHRRRMAAQTEGGAQNGWAPPVGPAAHGALGALGARGAWGARHGLAAAAPRRAPKRSPGWGRASRTVCPSAAHGTSRRGRPAMACARRGCRSGARARAPRARAEARARAPAAGERARAWLRSILERTRSSRMPRSVSSSALSLWAAQAPPNPPMNTCSHGSAARAGVGDGQAREAAQRCRAGWAGRGGALEKRATLRSARV